MFSNLRDLTKPRVAILVPIHNGASYLLRTLESLDSQDYENFEVVLCDDGSSDGSLQLCLDFAKSAKHKFSLLRHAKARGPSAAVFACASFARSRADLLTLFSHDDIMLQGFLRAVVKEFRSADVAIVSGSAYLIDATERRLGAVFCPPKLQFFGRQLTSLLMVKNVIVAVGATIRVEAVDWLPEVSPFHLCEDWERWLILSVHGKARFAPEAIVLYRVHASNLSHSKDPETQVREFQDMRASLIADANFRRSLRENRSKADLFGNWLGAGLSRLHGSKGENFETWSKYVDARQGAMQPGLPSPRSSKESECETSFIGDGSRRRRPTPTHRRLGDVSRVRLQSYAETAKLVFQAFVGNVSRASRYRVD